MAIFKGTAGKDRLVGTASADSLFGLAGDDTLIGNSGNDKLDGGGGADILFGNGGNDILFGGAGKDRLNGGSGKDSLQGGTGGDIYFIDSKLDSIVESLVNQPGDEVRAVISVDLTKLGGGGIENASLLGSAAIDIVGNSLANKLTGNAGANDIAGAAGKDTLTGGGGDDTLDGGLGADTMAGGTGNDTYIVDNLGDLVKEGSGGGTADQINASIDVDLTLAAFGGGAVENVLLLGSASLAAFGSIGANVLTGNDGANTIFGRAGADTIIGGAGSDIMVGGSGADTYVYGADDIGAAFLDFVTDFNNSVDTIDISELLVANVTSDITSVLASVVSNGNTIISIDFDGAGGNPEVGIVFLTGFTSTVNIVADGITATV